MYQHRLSIASQTCLRLTVMINNSVVRVFVVCYCQLFLINRYLV